MIISILTFVGVHLQPDPPAPAPVRYIINVIRYAEVAVSDRICELIMCV